MAERVLTLFPFGWQFPVLDAIEAYSTTVVLGGRGCGKSLLFQLSATQQAFRAPHRKIIYGCNSNDLVKEMFNDMKNSAGFRDLLLERHGYAEVPHPQFRFKNGSRLTMHSLEKMGKKLGLEAHVMYLDECREIKEESYHALVPFVSRLRGKMILLSSLKTRSHWFTQMYEQGQKPNPHGIKSFKVLSKEGIAYAGEEGARELARIEATTPRHVFRREYLCEPGTDCAVFPEEVIKRCTIADLKPQGGGSTRDTIMAWDLGRVRDPSCIIIGDTQGRLLHCEIFRLGMDWDDQVKQAKKLADAYRCTVVVESNGTNRDAMIGLLKPRLSPHNLRDVAVRAATKENLMNGVLLKMEKGELKIPDDPMFQEVIRQLEKIEFKDTATAVGYKCEGHDDYISCLMLYVEAWNRGWAGPAISTWKGDEGKPTRFL